MSVTNSANIEEFRLRLQRRGGSSRVLVFNKIFERINSDKRFCGCHWRDASRSAHPDGYNIRLCISQKQDKTYLLAISVKELNDAKPRGEGDIAVWFERYNTHPPDIYFASKFRDSLIDRLSAIGFTQNASSKSRNVNSNFDDMAGDSEIAELLNILVDGTVELRRLRPVLP